jgi:hypothetical protein
VRIDAGSDVFQPRDGFAMSVGGHDSNFSPGVALVRLAFGMMIAALFTIGCGKPKADYSLVDLVAGRGTVTLDGQPLAGAVVIFEDLTDGTFSYGMTDAAGQYVLQFDSEMRGVKTGKKVVRISTTRKLVGLNAKPGQEEEGEEVSASAVAGVEQVPDRYHQNSELTVEVTSESGDFNFDLTRG